MPTLLLTLGRLPKGLDLARGFAAIGWRVVVAEPFARHLCGASRDVAKSIVVPAPAAGQRAYLEALAAVVRAEEVALVLPVSEETMHVAFLPPLLPPGVRVVTMAPDALLPVYDKGGFIAFAQAHGLDVPESAALEDHPRAAALVAAGPVVVKPLHGCSGRGLRRLAQGAALPPPGAPALVQRLVTGEEFSTCAFAHRGRVLGNVVYRGTLMSGSVAVAFQRVDHPAIEAWVRRFVAAARWSGFIAFDLIVDAAGRPWGLECNPRTTSGLHFFEPADIARAILDPEGAPPPRHRPVAELQQFWSCLTETQLSLFRGGPFRANLRRLLATPDVCWQARDPWPLLSMPWTTWRIIRLAARRRVPFGEVATLDVGWTG
ncbi:ATP-grasp domain-containing protein [Falsiroseomonas selenitidurans]|uniref:ATP-grasp domain-containing protein n=1 Tax=Falsiroseomonas selenitidurans TaxID=2716335 RepID=A0ABX1EDH8_9PROT|nr:ATP-grasp domain-containing protein [Falsiroseomonas selenitidurans]NKC33957.1 ATP-grasp domain-containing protein [Falsiroseomonas selenitidurans]